MRRAHEKSKTPDTATHTQSHTQSEHTCIHTGKELSSGLPGHTGTHTHTEYEHPADRSSHQSVTVESTHKVPTSLRKGQLRTLATASATTTRNTDCHALQPRSGRVAWWTNTPAVYSLRKGQLNRHSASAPRPATTPTRNTD